METGSLARTIYYTLIYCDPGKAAKDGCLHQRIWVWYSWIDLRDKFCSGGNFYTSGHAYTDAGKAPGKLETKYKISNYGLVYVCVLSRV